MYNDYDEYAQQILIVVYKDEMLLNQVKKLVETKTADDSASPIKIVAWSEKVWQAQKKEGTITNKVLYLGDIKGTDSLIPVLDTKFEKHGVKYGWAGRQAALFADASEIKRYEQYEAFWAELNTLPIPDVVKDGNRPRPILDIVNEAPADEVAEPASQMDEKKGLFAKLRKVAANQAEIIGKNMRKAAVVASKASQDMFRNKTLVKRQMLFYGAIKLCEADLETFMES